RLQVAQLDPVERLALARLHELVLDDHVRIVVDEDFQARAKLVGAITCHEALARLLWLKSRRVRKRCAGTRRASRPVHGACAGALPASPRRRGARRPHSGMATANDTASRL